MFIKSQCYGCQENRNIFTEEAILYMNSLCPWVSYEDENSDDEEENVDGDHDDEEEGSEN